ncbi:type II secretion system F family protein [Desulforegula conservatrix]|uniref:type II secretion system F family protein n=1 Tax=Desulforegula conservatrix TaxID=153026 RepID=UPI000412E9EB|nr:type II secretion system F family protein [Desulforegula conservatrix]
MPSFQYKASDTSGKIQKGLIDAENEMGAASLLQKKGLIPIRIEQGVNQNKADSDIIGFLKKASSRVKSRDVMLFTQDLASLLAAGLPLDKALLVLSGSSENAAMGAIIREVLVAVQGGAYLSIALSRHPSAFSEFYINMIRAGEAGGVLEKVLERLGTFLETGQELREFISSALVYPIFLLVAGGVSVAILMGYVIPKFSMIFEGMGSALPISTKILLFISNGVKNYWWLGLIMIGAIVWGYKKFESTQSGRIKIDTFKLKMPILGDIIQKSDSARFSRTLGTLLQSGVPILDAIKLVKEIISNKVIASSLDSVHKRVKEGDRLSNALASVEIFPFLAIQMITVGEESGRMDEMLMKVADNYEKTLRNLLKRLISLLEPALILVMGVVVGGIVISMLLGIFSINDIPM